MKKLLIFGGAGFLGSCLVRFFKDDYNISVYSRDELKHWNLLNDFPKTNSYIGDIRDRDRVKQVIQECIPDTIIIASALKQIGQCENAPYESIQTNVLGIRNIIEESYVAKKCLFVSTDKACMPINVYGICKSLSEKIVIRESLVTKNTKYLIVRYGNILNSVGSIIPLFQSQAKNNQNITLTHDGMTRFFMSVENSIDLIHKALRTGNNGDIWIPIVPSMKIAELADIFSKEYNKPIKTIGIRSGEKIHEHLVSFAESSRVVKMKKHYVIKREIVSKEEFEYSSCDGILKKEQLKSKLKGLKII